MDMKLNKWKFENIFEGICLKYIIIELKKKIDRGYRDNVQRNLATRTL